MRRLSLIAVGAATAYVLGIVGLYSVGAGHVRRHNIEAATMVFAVVCLAALWTTPRSERSDSPRHRSGAWRIPASVVAVLGCASL